MAEPVAPRTLLEVMVRQRHLSWEEAANLVVKTARQHEQVSISLSGRHLGRLARNERPGTWPNPATRRALQYAFDRPVEELLAPLPPDATNVSISTGSTAVSQSGPHLEYPEVILEGAGPAAAGSAGNENTSDVRWAEQTDHWIDRAGVDLDNRQKDVDEECMTDQKRRDLLLSIAAQGGAVAVTRLFDVLHKTRLQANLLLEARSVSAATVGRWEEVAHTYGYLHLTTPPYTFLAQVTHDFSELQQILSRRQPLEFQGRLYRVMAQLAGLIGLVMNNISSESHSWFHTAQLAADEVGDRSLRAWAIAHESMSYLWWGRPVAQAIELSQKAQAVAGTTPNVGGAAAAAMEARAQARLGRRPDALAALHRSEVIFEDLGPADTATNVLGFYEHFLRFCQGAALTLLGETEGALTAQQRCFELPGGDVVDSSLVNLDRATCLIRDGELTEGCRIAGQTLLDLPIELRRGLPLIRAHEVMRIVAPRDRQLAPARDLEEIIRANTATST